MRGLGNDRGQLMVFNQQKQALCNYPNQQQGKNSNCKILTWKRSTAVANRYMSLEWRELDSARALLDLNTAMNVSKWWAEGCWQWLPRESTFSQFSDPESMNCGGPRHLQERQLQYNPKNTQCLHPYPFRFEAIYHNKPNSGATAIPVFLEAISWRNGANTDVNRCEASLWPFCWNGIPQLAQS